MKKILLFLWVSSLGASSRPVVSTWPQLGFHEKKFRHLWDRGCADWPLLLQEGSNPGFVFERKNKMYRLLGKAKFKPAWGESMEQARTRLENILQDFQNFPQWILPGVNDHPEKGRTFFVELLGLQANYLKRPYHALLTGPFHFNVAGFSLKGRTTIEILLEKEALPKCPLFEKSKSQAQVWRFRMIPRPDILDWLIGELYVVETASAFEIRARVSLKPSSLIYALLPTKVIENELKLRGQKMLSNLIELRRQKAWERGKGDPIDASSAKAAEN